MLRKHTTKLILINASIILIILIVLGIVVLKFVKVPYTVIEITERTYPYNETVYYNETEEMKINVPYQVEEKYTYETEISPPSAKQETRARFLQDRDCRLENYHYTLNYFGTLTDRNTYDLVTKIGYYNGAVRIGVEICNFEKRRMRTDLKICHYVGEKKFDCPDRLVTTIRSDTCEKRILKWVTTFDANKRILLEEGEVSQKFVCEQNPMVTGSEESKPATVYYNVAGLDISKHLEGEDTMPLTQSGRLGAPVPKSNLIRDEVSTAQVHGTRLVTKYREETVSKEVPKSKTVTNYRTVIEKTEITKYRPLWEEVKIMLGI